MILSGLNSLATALANRRITRMGIAARDTSGLAVNQRGAFACCSSLYSNMLQSLIATNPGRGLWVFCYNAALNDALEPR